MEETRSDCGFTEEELRLIAIDLGLSRREGDVLILAFQNVKRDAMGPKLVKWDSFDFAGTRTRSVAMTDDSADRAGDFDCGSVSAHRA